MDSTMLCVGLLLVYIFWRYYFSIRNLPPGPRWGLPLLGNLLSLNPKLPHTTLAKYAREHGEIMSLKMGRKWWIVINDHNLLREAFNNPDLNGRPVEEAFHTASGGKYGVIFTDGEEWNAQRRFVLRTLRDFGFGKKSMESIIMEEVEELIESIRQEAGQPICVQHKFSLAVLNGLWAIVSGQRFSQDDPTLHSIIDSQNKLFAETFGNVFLSVLPESVLKLAPRFFGLQKLRRAAEGLLSILRAIVKDHQETIGAGDSARDFTDQYLREIESTTDPSSSFYKEVGVKSLVAVLSDLFNAGSETTATTLGWAVLHLAVNPKIQKKLQAELDAVVGKNRPVTLDDRANLPYTEALMQEVHRIASLASFGVPHRAMRDTQLRGYTIPEGSLVIANINYIQNNPDVWGDPENLRPERFLEADGTTPLKREAFVAFSAGKRQCLGENLARSQFFLFLANLFQRLAVEVDPAGGVPTFVPVIGFGVLLHPQKYQVVVRDRVQQSA